MASLCIHCAKGPHGIGGHEALEMISRDENWSREAVAFKCTICLNIWLRTYEGSGVFKWLLQDAAQQNASGALRASR